MLKAFALAFLMLFFSSAAKAREPAATVVELVLMDGVPPAPCQGLVLHDRGLYFDAGMIERFARGGDATLVVEPGLRQLEQTGRIVLVRTDEGCTVFFSGRALPAPKRVAEALAWPLEITGWRADADGMLELKRKGVLCSLSPGASLPLGSLSDNELRLAHYGILPLYFETPSWPLTELSPGPSQSIHFSGSGDEAHYRIMTRQAGMLIVEYRSSSGPGSLDIDIRDAQQQFLGTGSAVLSTPGVLLIRLQYRGAGPADVDVGFLFTPDQPLSCTLEARAVSGAVVAARLYLHNRSSEPLWVTAPGPSSVRWYADARLIGIARPGRLPEQRMLEPGASLEYSARLELPPGSSQLAAEIDSGEAGTVRCDQPLPP